MTQTKHPTGEGPSEEGGAGNTIGTPASLPEHSFTVYLSGERLCNDDADAVDSVLNELFEAGCDDATIGTEDGVIWSATFDREAWSMSEAVRSALADIGKVRGVKVGGVVGVTNPNNRERKA